MGNTVRYLATGTLFLVLLLGLNRSAAGGAGELCLQVVRPAGETVLWEVPVRGETRFTMDYHHSSDHTPVHDVFQITQEGEIVLIEESYLWYGAGLAFHPADGVMKRSEGRTRFLLNRKFPHFLLRVGEVANQVLTVNGQAMPLLQIAKGRELVWIRVTKKSGTSR